MYAILVTTLAAFQILLSGWLNVVRGGSHGWLKAPSWLPGRQLCPPVFMMPMLVFPPDGPYWLTAVAFVSLCAVFLAVQGLGHGSYMDAGTYGQRDNESLSWILDLIPGLKEQVMLDGQTGIPLTNEKGQKRIVDNPLRDFVGGLIKGILMTLPFTIVSIMLYSSYQPLMFLAAGIFYPVAWFINNRWYAGLQQKRLFGAPVYWAELFQGIAFALAAWLSVV